jgi:RNA ligase (TIGR02306 family)
MASFDVKIRRLTVEPHPNADRLDIVKVDGYVCVSQKGRFTTDDVAIYVPTDAVVPEAILQASGFWDEERGKGMLAGSKGNRVKPVRLRGVLSEGILLDISLLDSPDGVVTWTDGAEGTEVGTLLGIEKYVAPIPVHLAGDVKNCPGPIHAYTDVENIKKYPDALVEGEEVVATEKAHGSCMIVMLHEGEFYVSSKGFAGKGQYLEDTKNEQGASTNAYWRAFYAAGLDEKLRKAADDSGAATIYLFGEILGTQDMKYGMENGDVRFVAFDVQIGENKPYLDFEVFTSFCYTYRIPQVPTLYEGPFSWEAIGAVTDGMENLTGSESHIREGVVIRPRKERHIDTLGRVLLKSVSESYLTRRDGTEWQ